MAWLKPPFPSAVSLLLIFQVCFFSWPLALESLIVSTAYPHMELSTQWSWLPSADRKACGPRAELLWGDRIAPRTPDPDRDPPGVCYLIQVWQDEGSKLDRWLESEKGLPAGSLCNRRGRIWKARQKPRTVTSMPGAAGSSLSKDRTCLWALLDV